MQHIRWHCQANSVRPPAVVKSPGVVHAHGLLERACQLEAHPKHTFLRQTLVLTVPEMVEE